MSGGDLWVKGPPPSLVLTAGEQGASLTNSFTYDLLVLQTLAEKTNAPATGSVSLSVVGAGFATSSLTAMSRITASSAEATHWQSETSFMALASAGLQQWNNAVEFVAYTILGRINSVSLPYTYDTPQVSSKRVGNEILLGNSILTVIGNGFGTTSRTLRAFSQSSSCEASDWISDSTILCGQSNAFAKGSGSIGLTALGSVATLSEALSYDSPMVSSVQKTNIAAPLQARILTISGFNFAYTNPRSQHSLLPSMGVRLQATSVEQTTWVSQTAIIVKKEGRSGSPGSMSLMVTAGATLGSITESLSYDSIASSTTLPTNTPATGSSSITVSGFGFGDSSGRSLATRIGPSGTGCEASLWVSETSVQCLRSSGLGKSRRISVTASNVAASQTEALSYDTGSFLVQKTLPGIGFVQILDSGTGYVNGTFSGVSSDGSGGFFGRFYVSANGSIISNVLVSVGLMPQPWQTHFDLKSVLALPEAVATDSEVAFGEPVRPGDQIHCCETLRSLSEVKTTKLGTGRFWVIDAVCSNQNGLWVGTETMTGFGYRNHLAKSQD